MTAARGRVLVLDGDTRAGLEMARRLHRLGERVAIASSEARASGMRTGAAEARVVLPDPRSAFDAYADGIVESLGAGDVALCSGERALEALRARRDAIAARGAVAAIASEPALTIAGSKQLTLDRATALGISSPRSLQVTTPEQVMAGADELGYPLVVKPLASWRALPGGGGETVAPMLAYDRAGLEKVAHRLVRPDAPALLQQVATGVRETHKFVLQDGRMIARLVMVAERCWPPLGRLVRDARDGRAPGRLPRPRAGARDGRRPGRRLRSGVPPRRRRPPAADGDQRAHLANRSPWPTARASSSPSCSSAGRAASTWSRWPTTAAASASAGRPARPACSPAA